MARTGLLLPAMLLTLARCLSSGPTRYHKGEQQDFTPDPDPDPGPPPTTDFKDSYFGFDFELDDDHPDHPPTTQQHHVKALVAPANIILDRPIADIEATCPLTPKSHSRMADVSRGKNPYRQKYPFNAPLPRAQVEHPATIDDLLSGACADVIVIWARGTGNTGNIGSALGRCFMAYLKGNLDYTLMGQGVLPYPAGATGFLGGGSRQGARSMVRLVMLAVEQCPQSKIVLGGFSQGAQVLRRAVERIPESVAGNIAAVVSFSDSREGQPLDGPLRGKHVSFCYDGDWVCDGKHTVLTGKHKSIYYYDQLSAAFEFVEGRLVEEGMPVRVSMVRPDPPLGG